MDVIIIQDLALKSRVGITKEEYKTPQRLLVSVELALDLRAAGRTDDMSATVCYDTVASLIQQVASEKPRHLLETVAEDMVRAILNNKQIEMVTLEVKKFSIPKVAHVAVRILRKNS